MTSVFFLSTHFFGGEEGEESNSATLALAVEMAVTVLTLRLLLVGSFFGQTIPRSMIMHIEADTCFSPSNLTTIYSQILTRTSLNCAQGCLASDGCRVASYTSLDSTCSIYNVYASEGSLLSSFSDTTYVVLSVTPTSVPGKDRCLFRLSCVYQRH